MNTNPAEDIFTKYPLMNFSIYVEGQYRTLLAIGQEINERLDAAVKPSPDNQGEVIDGNSFNWVYGRFWLWLLGAYEVVRTMDEAKRCFSEALANQLTGLKIRLAKIRMPMAKHELRGNKKVPVCAELSIVTTTKNPFDLHFMIDGELFSVRETITDFTGVFNSITREDVLADHRTLYAPRPAYTFSLTPEQLRKLGRQ